MTGRELLHDTTVGIAYLDTVCSLQSASLTEARAGKLSAALISLVAAHEIGHNFGAPHDGEAGKACATISPGAYLMAPTLSTANSQFSQCSLDVIAQRVAAAQCLTAAARSGRRRNHRTRRHRAARNRRQLRPHFQCALDRHARCAGEHCRVRDSGGFDASVGERRGRHLLRDGSPGELQPRHAALGHLAHDHAFSHGSGHRH